MNMNNIIKVMKFSNKNELLKSNQSQVKLKETRRSLFVSRF